MTNRLPIALTLGDPAGIGPELAAAAWRELRSTNQIFFWIGPASLIEGGVPVNRISAPAEADSVFAHALPVIDMPCHAPVVPGKPDPLNAVTTVASIELAVQFALSGEAGGVVTNPIAKHVLAQAGFPYPGHTEFLAALCRVPGREVMMLASPELKVVPVTIHVSLRHALDSLTSERIETVTRLTNAALKRDFGIASPRLAMAGLNPHAGEHGMMGTEEQTIIMPAVERLRSLGVNVSDPMPPDTMFSATARPHYDAAICMYHDQALIPLKTLDMAQGVNITLGLPIVRTSPDHGTAFDIASSVTSTAGRASASSLLAAIRIAVEMSQHRLGAKK